MPLASSQHDVDAGGQGGCYIDTINLDGEANLKRHSDAERARALADRLCARGSAASRARAAAACARGHVPEPVASAAAPLASLAKAELRCIAPDDDLYSFGGNIALEDDAPAAPRARRAATSARAATRR